MAGNILEFPRDEIEREAVEILRLRHSPNKGGYTAEEIAWAVQIVQGWDPDHPFLRYSERQKVLLKPDE
jgi:hypothetical protein